MFMPNPRRSMLRRLRKLTLPAVAMITATLAISVPSAGAAPAVVSPVTGLATAVTTSPAATWSMLGAGILPLPTETTQESFQLVPGGLGVHFIFPVDSGTFDSSGPSGTVGHSGGVRFVSFASFRMLKFSGLQLILDGAPRVEAVNINNVHSPIKVFDVDLSGASVSTSGSTTTIANVTLKWAPEAATLLDTSLLTGAFVAGATFGTATTQVVSS